MAAGNALHKIRQIRQRYILYWLVADALLAIAIALVVASVLHFAFSLPILWAVLFFVLSFVVLVTVRAKWKTSDGTVANFLDASYPELEESCNLVFAQTGDMDLLQRLQLLKVTEALEHIPSNHQYFTRPLKRSVSICLGALIFAFLTGKVHYSHGVKNFGENQVEVSGKNSVPEKVLPQISSVEITTTPPAYTRVGSRTQDKFTLNVEEGSVVSWKLKTNIATQNVSLLFNEQESLPLKAADGSKTEWIAQKGITRAGFYQVVIDGKRSDLYQLQVIKDNVPVIQVKTPKQYTYIDAGEKPQVALTASVSDDYGVSDALIYTTVAKGSGEAVKFKEQKLSFDQSFSGQQRKYDLNKVIDLPKLGLEPGDELYFYIQAKDNHQQTSRTDVYIVSIQDTAQLLSMDGIVGATNIKPEYFRSERQIILDSESLLKAKDTLSQQAFNDRSNELGTDQKLLRLRYGKFLGEESENEIADPRGEKGGEPADPKDFGNGAKILDEYTDKHDNAEDAEFFDPAIKAQLKATLTEMWKAELQLRLNKPADALPFEYKALRLLKDLQQKSRSYVAKTAFNPTPLKMDKRLSGDLTKIIQPADHQDIHAAADQFDAVRKSIAILDRLKISPVLNGNDYRTLQSANLQISAKATQQPGTYLAAASAMRRLLAGNKTNTPADVATVEQAIQKMLPSGLPLPQNSSSGPDMGLSHGYYLKLNRINR